jgi:hypothetical protein
MGVGCFIEFLAPPSTPTLRFTETYDAPPSGGFVLAADPNIDLSNITGSTYSTDNVSPGYSFRNTVTGLAHPGYDFTYTLPTGSTKVSFRTDFKRDNFGAAVPNEQRVMRLFSGLGFSGPFINFSITNLGQLRVEDVASGYISPLIGSVGAIVEGTWYNLRWDVTLNTPGIANGAVEVFINGVSTYSTTTANILAVSQTPSITKYRFANNLNLVGGSVPSPNPYFLYDNTSGWAL